MAQARAGDRQRAIKDQPPVTSPAPTTVVGAVDDPAELEADRMADAVLRSLRRSPSAVAAPRATRIARAPERDTAAEATTTANDEVDPDLDPDDLDAENAKAGGGEAVVRRKFDPALVTSNAHLRDSGQWGTMKGPKIKKGATVLVNTAAPETQQKKGSTVTWYPAVNAGPDDWGTAIAEDRRGLVRSSRVQRDARDLNTMLATTVRRILLDVEAIHPMLAPELAKQANVDVLMQKALRIDEWNDDNTTAPEFAPAFGGLLDKIARIRDGAQYVGDMVEHWRTWLHPDGRTMIWELDIIGSDLHEHGLGVIKAEFRKSPGPIGHKFAADTTVKTFLKPEDKSLEQALLGSDAGSAANRINQIAGLNNVDEMLTTIRMEATANHGTLVEAAKGMAAEKIVVTGHQKAVKQAFHETLVFAFLAGIDDLHKENVFWHEGRPYMIDADNVLSHNQMLKVDNGDIDQSGFTRDTDQAATANRNAVKANDNSAINSKILDAMLNNAGKRVQIAQVLRQAITGKKGRVVPIRTNKWANLLRLYRDNEPLRDQILDDYSGEPKLVRDGVPFDRDVGPGLIGVCGENAVVRLFDSPGERAQLQHDFEAGVIPFYEYDFTTGRVTHNGRHVWNGLTVDQAIGALLDRFDPSGVSRTNAGL